MTVRERLAEGRFNDMSREDGPDGADIITMTKRGDPSVYKLLVRNLYREDEEVLREEVIER